MNEQDAVANGDAERQRRRKPRHRGGKTRNPCLSLENRGEHARPQARWARSRGGAGRPSAPWGGQPAHPGSERSAMKVVHVFFLKILGIQLCGGTRAGRWRGAGLPGGGTQGLEDPKITLYAPSKTLDRLPTPCRVSKDPGIGSPPLPSAPQESSCPALRVYDPPPATCLGLHAVPAPSPRPPCRPPAAHGPGSAPGSRLSRTNRIRHLPAQPPRGGAWGTSRGRRRAARSKDRRHPGPCTIGARVGAGARTVGRGWLGNGDPGRNCKQGRNKRRMATQGGGKRFRRDAK